MDDIVYLKHSGMQKLNWKWPEAMQHGHSCDINYHSTTEAVQWILL